MSIWMSANTSELILSRVFVFLHSLVLFDEWFINMVTACSVLDINVTNHVILLYSLSKPKPPSIEQKV